MSDNQGIFKKMLNCLSTPVGIYILWILLHFIAPHLYVYFCAPGTPIGFILSPFVALAPHCAAIRWVISSSGDMISSMWIVIGGWFIKTLIIKN